MHYVIFFCADCDPVKSLAAYQEVKLETSMADKKKVLTNALYF